MPNIDNFRLKEKYRAWDSNILDKLKIPDSEKKEDLPIEKKQQEVKVKPRTNRGQTGDKPRTNRGQTEDKPRTEKTNRGQTGDGTEDKTEDKPRTNRGQTEDKIEEKSTFFSLSGLQKKITFYIYEMCKISRDKKTQPLSLEQIANNCKTTKISAKKTVQRLEKKEIIARDNFKAGRGGWTSYHLPKDVFQEILYLETEDKPRTNWGQTEDKLGTELGTEPRTSPSSSSSLNNYLNTTTTSEGKNEGLVGLDEEWLKIDFESLANIGFTETHLKQIASQGLLKPDMVQNSIHAFAFDLENNEKGKSIRQPLNYFMGVLRKGQPYAPPDNYEHPKDRLMRLYAEKMKRVEKEREAVQKEAEELAFGEWFYKLTDDEVKKLLPGNINVAADRAIKESPMARGVARNYFKEKVWSDLKKSIEDAKQPEEEI